MGGGVLKVMFSVIYVETDFVNNHHPPPNWTFKKSVVDLLHFKKKKMKAEPVFHSLNGLYLLLFFIFLPFTHTRLPWETSSLLSNVSKISHLCPPRIAEGILVKKYD